MLGQSRMVNGEAKTSAQERAIFTVDYYSSANTGLLLLCYYETILDMPDATKLLC